MSYVILRVFPDSCASSPKIPPLSSDSPFKPYYFIFENFSYAKGV
jgi:hypothetical protein